MATPAVSRFLGAAAWACAAAGIAIATAVAAFPGLAIPGVSSDHFAAFLPVALLPLMARGFHRVARRAAAGNGALAGRARHYLSLSGPARLAASLLVVGAVVHLALLPSHLAMEPQTGVLFALDAAGFIGAAVWTLSARHWRIPAALAALITGIAYATYIHSGLEDLDAVGLVTTAAELLVVPVALADWVRSCSGPPSYRLLAAATAVAMALAGCGTIANAANGTSTIANTMARVFPAPGTGMGGDTAAAPGGAAAMSGAGASAGGGAMSGMTGSGGAMSGMTGSDGTMSTGSPMMPPAQTAAGMTNSVCPNVAAMPMSNGMLMQPVPATPPTQAEVDAASQLVSSTAAGIAQYSDISVAEAAGYAPATRTNVPVVHLVNRQYFANDPLADPSHPQALVYAHSGSTWTLLGAMYLTNGICKEGPDIGGSLTDWHAHVNLCFSATHTITGRHPDASGQCPAGSTTHGTPFMLHVYTVPNNPSGPWELSNTTLHQIIGH